MSTTTPLAPRTPGTPAGSRYKILDVLGRKGPMRLVIIGVALLVLLSLVRAITGANGLTSSSTVEATLRLAVPLLLAGLAGLWAERVGIVNIGIEGMMILGTFAGGFGAWKFGPWMGLAFGIVGGIIGGLIHALATIRFNVDHVISGVALNILALGVTQYLAAVTFKDAPGGGVSKSPPRSSAIDTLSMPVLAGGKPFGWESPDLLGSLEDKHWFLLSDIAGIARGLMFEVSLATIVAIVLVPITAYLLWRTKFGLRLRSSGEAPSAAESLGVKVIRLRYQAMVVSGGLAGLGGAFLAVVASSAYQEGQTANRGYIGLAIMIFGNWRPVGLLGGAGLFGYTDSLQLLSADSIPALFLFVTALLFGLAIMQFRRKRPLVAVATLIVAAGFLLANLTVTKLPTDLVTMSPYVVTLLVLAAASQRLRPPAHAGLPYRSGEDH
ncbi:ABC transporter permease [Nakamurella antarctica]|uniref:ABC transporter permease n=1 Tax=Nakamurella antarctica TaxID=1902245 RepID=A0A3G8ZMV5_9ACTN|nr:ABC transporter permease [Nakamurella antarctica]AZI58583.1 ABC transporter permease [Nakamurella antarctica]